MLPSEEGVRPTRRRLLRDVCGCALGLCGAGGGLGWTPDAIAATASAKPSMTPEQALERLRRGNESFVRDHAGVSPQGLERRREIARSQAPFAVLVGCSDSRVSPELLFDTGLGDLFIIRNAGNSVGPVSMGSIEYGVLMLGAPLVVVLGHERCGAVDAALSVVRDQLSLPGSIGSVVDPILPAARGAIAEGRFEGAALLDEAVRLNVVRVVEQLRRGGEQLAGPLKEGRLRVIGARYDLDDGSVTFYDG